MEDLASEFQADFLEAVKVLEDFSSSDGDLREAMREIRERIAAKRYVCAPNFWDDLRETLGAIEQQRAERSSKSKAQQVMKQIARLEVRFWAKESVGMLRELDAESRLERMVDWIATFDANETGDQSSGPAVLYQVLNDISLQKDMEQAPKEALAAAVRENLHKFPVEMQAVLERVGSLQGGGGVGGPRALSDWRRRNQPAAVQGEPLVTSGRPPAGGGTRLTFVPAPRAPDAPGDGSLAVLPAFGSEREAAAVAAGGPGGPGASGGEGLQGAAPAVAGGGEEEQQPEDEEAAAFEPFNVAEVDPEVLARARRAVLAMLQANGGECPKQYVRTLLKQAGVAGLPIAALGDEVFFSATEVFLRGAPAAPSVPGRPVGSPVPEELKQLMVAVVREAGGRLSVAQLTEKLQWHAGSVRHNMHGPLKKALARVPELFFEPRQVFTAAAAAKHLAPPAAGAEAEGAEGVDGTLLSADAEQSAAGGEADAMAAGTVPYVADPFAEFIKTVLTWLQQAGGVLGQEAVMPLIKALGFRPRAVMAALARDAFWSHPEADCEILLRTAAGAAQHPRPLPEVYLHKQVHISLVKEVRAMGAKAKADKLAGSLGWNQKSELRRTYGTLRVVLGGLREVFFDPKKIYLKRVLDGLVEWPVSREGRMGPQQQQQAPSAEEEALRHWTRAADDPKGAGDPEWQNAKRQLLGTVMRSGGRCEASILRRLLHPIMEGVELESLFERGAAHDLNDVLFWGRRQVHVRRAAAVDAGAPQPCAEAQGLPAGSAMLLTIAVRSRGAAGASVEELQASLEEAGGQEEGEGGGAKVDEQQLCCLLQQMPELFYMPDMVFLRHIAETLLIEAPATGQEQAQAEEEASADATLAAVAEAMAASPGGSSPGASATPALGDAPPAAAARAPAPLAAEPPDSGAATFFSFSEFSPTAVHDAPATNSAEPMPAKRRRLAEGGATSGAMAAAAAVPSWGSEAAPWATEGAVVVVRSETADAGMEGVIVRAHGATCLVRLTAGAGAALERDFPTPSLVPVTPKVGATVKVVVGDRSGCRGSLVGLAGADGVVQIGKMSYETLPMSHLAVVAALV